MSFPGPPPTNQSQSSGFVGDWKIACLFFGVLLAAPAALLTFVNCYFLRLEDAGDYEATMCHDLAAGGMLAVAFVLLCAPHLPSARRRAYAFVAVVALLIWAVVSGTLIWVLEE